MTASDQPEHSPPSPQEGYVGLAELLRLHPPAESRIISPGDLLIIRYQPGMMTDDQFAALEGALGMAFPDLKFILIDCDEVRLEPGLRVIRGSSRPEGGT